MIINLSLSMKKILIHFRKNWYKYGAEDAIKLIKNTGVDTDDLNTFSSTYIELTNTGKLSIIRNEKLKQSITASYRLNEELASNIHEFNIQQHG